MHEDPPGIKRGLLENPPFTPDFAIKTSIDRGFSIATFDHQRVLMLWYDLQRILTDDHDAVELTSVTGRKCDIWISTWVIAWQATVAKKTILWAMERTSFQKMNKIEFS